MISHLLLSRLWSDVKRNEHNELHQMNIRHIGWWNAIRALIKTKTMNDLCDILKCHCNVVYTYYSYRCSYKMNEDILIIFIIHLELGQVAPNGNTFLVECFQNDACDWNDTIRANRNVLFNANRSNRISSTLNVMNSEKSIDLKLSTLQNKID